MLMGIIFMWIITAAGLVVVVWLVPGVRAHSTGGLLWATMVLGLVNAFTLWLAAAMAKGFEINGFDSAFLGTLVMVLLGVIGFVLLHWFMGGRGAVDVLSKYARGELSLIG